MCLSIGAYPTAGIIKSTQQVEAAEGTGFTSYDFLKVEGTYIKNNSGKGNNVYLRGTNIGNLFVQESWMSSTDAKDQKTIIETLTNRFGQDKALELLDYYESNYFTEDDLEKCKNMGMSVIRVPFTYMNLYKKTGNNWVLRSDAFNRLDWIVEQAGKRGIYVILDLHGAFGSQSGQDHSGEVIDNVADVTFFSNETLQNQTLDMWKVIANHYKGNPAVAAYDTLNEPGEKAGSTGEKHWAFYDKMYKAIRSVDPDHILIMESCWGTANLPNPSRYGWTNVVYEYHHYPWSYVDDNEANLNGQKTAIDNLVNSVNNANYGVPTYIGEFNCFDGDAKWQYVLKKMNDAGWHYTNWSYKARGMGSWGIYHETANQAKVKPAEDSESTIRTKWGSGSIGTNASSTGVTYNNMKSYMPGTVVFADKALTDDDFFAIKANINSKYVCADKYGEAKLVADRDSFGGWEEFRVINNADGTISFQSRSNNKYLCAIFDDADTENPIKARSNKISDWEKFYLVNNNDGTYSLRTYTNSKYVQTDINDATAGILHAASDTIGTWEKFTFVAVSNQGALPQNATSQPATTQNQQTSNQQQTSQSSQTTVNCPGAFEIDSYSAKSSEVTISTNNGVKLAGNLVNGSYLEYKVNVAKAGKYDFNLNLATTSADRTLTISVDGSSVGTIKPQAAAGWFDFAPYKLAINFAAGVHTVKISASASCNISGPSFTEWEEEVSVEIPQSTSTTKFGNNFKVVAYYPNWYGNYTSKVQWDKLTHCYYAFGLPSSSGDGTMASISGESSNIQAMINACNQHNVVPVLSVGGWSHSGSSDGLCKTVFEWNTNTEAKRQSLANSIVTQAKAQGFKGVDIDWEYPTSSSQAQYVDFMKKLRTLCDQNGMILTVAVAATSGSGFTSEVLDLLDFVNLMAYDGNEGSGHSPYSLATQSFNYWKNTMGVPANKLVIGVPFYERPNWASYADIVAKNSAYAQQDSAVINGTTVYYNGIPTMKQKAQYAAQNAGGIMIWEISQDATSQDLSLLTAINSTILPIVGTGSTTTATVTDVPGTVKVDSFGGKSSGITINTSGTPTYAGNITSNAYLDYYIKVAQKGTYTLTLNLAAGDAQYNAKNILVKLNDNTVVTVPITASSSWTTFVPHTATVTFAAKGTYKISLVSDGGACNITDFTLTKNEETTTQAPTQAPTVAPTETSTESPTEAPSQATGDVEEVFGVVVSSNQDNKITVVWGRNIAMEEKGQLYNVYVDGVLKYSKVPCAEYLIENVSGGNHTVRVSSVNGNSETAGFVGTVNVSGGTVVETEAPTEAPTAYSDSVKLTIEGYQISTSYEGHRVLYSISDPENKVVDFGLVYALSGEVSESDVYYGSNPQKVFAFQATSAGKVSYHSDVLADSTSYAMTMKFIKNAEYYNSGMYVRAYAHLANGEYVYSDVSESSVYQIADTLYQNRMMNNKVSHDYLFNTILKVAKPDYAERDYDYGFDLVS
jgi:GH18 family chitinase/aryl-phospho-beta-D-glucosidase BglC (GH1 family)